MGEGKERIDTIKDVIKRLHASGGSNREALEREFADKIRNASALEISQAEQEAIDGGVSVDSIRSLCAVHLEMFAKEKQDETIDVEPWHPLHILMEEHTDMANRVRGLTAYVHAILHDGDRERGAAGLRAAAGYLDEMELYFQKEENALFPVLERHDIVQPPAVMWSEHDELRALRKRFRAEVDGPCEEIGRAAWRERV
mgnify:FL=1